jgi:hypothetical protein
MKPRSCGDFHFEVPDADHGYTHLVSGEPVHMRGPSGARCFSEAKNTAGAEQNRVLAIHGFGQGDGGVFAGRSRASRDDAGGVSRWAR